MMAGNPKQNVPGGAPKGSVAMVDWTPPGETFWISPVRAMVTYLLLSRSIQTPSGVCGVVYVATVVTTLTQQLRAQTRDPASLTQRPSWNVRRHCPRTHDRLGIYQRCDQARI